LARIEQITSGHTIISTTDVEDATLALSDSYLPLRLEPQDERALVATRLHVVDLGLATVGTLRFGADVRMVTADAANYHLNLPLTGRCQSARSGMPDVVVVPGSGEVFVPGTPADLRWRSDTEQICVMLDRSAVERTLSAMLGRDLREPLRFDRTLDLDTSAGQTWGHILKLISHETRRRTGLLTHPLTRHTLEQLLMDGFLASQGHNYCQQLDDGPRATGPRPIAAAVTLLEARPEAPWTTSRLAAEVGLSSRALQNGFRAATSSGPMTYLRSVRLERAHEELRTAGPDTTTVSSIARRWGFTHLGRFSALYRRTYGRLPSETLRD
jgi:AraC-like DNA-binding protein